MVELVDVCKSTSPLQPLQSIGAYISDILESKTAQNIVSINLIGKSDLADEMIIVSGNSTTHIGALAEHVAKAFRQAGVEVLSICGKPNNRWVIVDTADVIVHIFHPEEREIYHLEKMWSDELFGLDTIGTNC